MISFTFNLPFFCFETELVSDLRDKVFIAESGMVPSLTWMTLTYTTDFVLFAFQVSLQKIKTEQMQRKLTRRNLELVPARDLPAQKSRNEKQLRISRDLKTCRKLTKELPGDVRGVRGVVRPIRDESEFNFSTLLMAISGQYPGVDLRFEGIDNLDITSLFPLKSSEDP